MMYGIIYFNICTLVMEAYHYIIYILLCFILVFRHPCRTTVKISHPTCCTMTTYCDCVMVWWLSMGLCHSTGCVCMCMCGLCHSCTLHVATGALCPTSVYKSGGVNPSALAGPAGPAAWVRSVINTILHNSESIFSSSALTGVMWNTSHI